MAFKKLDNFTFNHKDQQDELYKTMNPEQVKAAFDSRADELKVVVNDLITELEENGASSLGAAGGNVQTILNNLKSVLDSTVIRTSELEDIFSQFTLSDGNSNPEIILARTDSVTGTAYSLIADRMRLMDSRTVENSSAITSVNDNINSINSNINTTNSRVTANANNIAAANSRIDATNSSIASVNSRIDSTTSLVGGTQKAISQLNVGKRQYIKFFPTGDRVQIAYKYADANSLIGRLGEDAIIEFGISSGVNRLFQILRFWKKSNSEFFPDTNLTSYSPWFECNSDIVGPFVVKATANGNANPFMYTGGVFGFGGMNSGTATARQVVFEIYADGRKLNAGDEVFADVITIRSVQRVQGYNTKVSAGGGREILQQTTHYQIIDGSMEISNSILALEAVTIESYFGLQFPWDAATPYLYGTVHYVNGDVKNSTARKQLLATGEHNAGTKLNSPNATRFTIKSQSDDHIVNVWMDEASGLGDGSNVSSAVSRIFSQPGKTYMSMVYGVDKPISANGTVSWRGGVSLFKNSARAMDVVGKMSKNNKVWTFIDFLYSGSELQFIQPETMFYTDYQIDSKSSTVENPSNSFTTRSVYSSGYGQIIYRINK